MPSSWREVRRQWRTDQRTDRDAWREQWRLARDERRGMIDPPTNAPVEQRIVAFRRGSVQTAISVGVLAAINAVTSPIFPWFLIPSAFLGLRLLRRGGSLWADGVRMRDVFGKNARLIGPNEPMAPARRASTAELAAVLAPRDVLAGRHGEVVRRAASDRAIVREVVEKLGKADRELIPDVLPTADALAERVSSLAQALHRLDEDVSPDAIVELDARIAAARSAPESTPDGDRKIALLERQRSTLSDLVERRGTLVSQLESASLMLQNMKLDLLALRSAGVQSSLDDNTGATQEARALSREIAHVLEAAKEIRK
jgi:serine/threonine-protein kinase